MIVGDGWLRYSCLCNSDGPIQAPMHLLTATSWTEILVVSQRKTGNQFDPAEETANTDPYILEQTCFDARELFEACDEHKRFGSISTNGVR